MIYTAEYTTFPAKAGETDTQIAKTSTFQVDTDAGFLAAEAEAMRQMNELQAKDPKNIYTFTGVRS
jgi:hypothetical protein